jgi:hypothetical protein
MSAVIAWYVLSRGPSGSRRWGEPAALTFLVVLGMSALMSYAYAKDEIMSTAGVFYAVAAYTAMRGLLDLRPRAWIGLLLLVLSIALGTAWAIRTAGFHLRLRHGAFEARAEWAYILSPMATATWPKDPHTLRVVSRMREEALLQRTITPALLPRWTERWWGED